MDALILCGGYAKRLEPLSLFIPKALLPVNGRPLLDNIVDDLLSCQEVERIIISTNAKFADQFKYYIEGKRRVGSAKKIDLIVEPTVSNEQKFGSIGAIHFAINREKIASDLLIVFGDNYFDFGVKPLIDSVKSNGSAAIALFEASSRDDAKRFGVVELKGSRIVGFEEKPEEPKTLLLSTGIYLFPKSSIGMFDSYIMEKNNPDAMGNFVKWYIGRSDAEGIVCKGRWIDIGNLETYRQLFEQLGTGEPKP
ncbi:MAG: nucleotidyltransferase family protein [Candidatus Micrarchaeota archaeon]|nr:nucleotidyltransferase family protein [Candidatus Micrarchaeota archaeon]